MLLHILFQLLIHISSAGATAGLSDLTQEQITALEQWSTGLGGDFAEDFQDMLVEARAAEAAQAEAQAEAELEAAEFEAAEVEPTSETEIAGEEPVEAEAEPTEAETEMPTETEGEAQSSQKITIEGLPAGFPDISSITGISGLPSGSAAVLPMIMAGGDMEDAMEDYQEAQAAKQAQEAALAESELEGAEVEPAEGEAEVEPAIAQTQLQLPLRSLNYPNYYTRQNYYYPSYYLSSPRSYSTQARMNPYSMKPGVQGFYQGRWGYNVPPPAQYMDNFEYKPAKGGYVPDLLLTRPLYYYQPIQPFTRRLYY